METEQLIKQLKESNLYAECSCGGEFKLSSAILFDGTKGFPPEALEKQKELKEELKERDEVIIRDKISNKEKEIVFGSALIG